MRPHEETWEQYESGIANHGIYRKNPRRTVATRIGTHGEARLLSAAPEMARALLREQAQHSVVTTREEAEAVTEAQAALKKAGVLP